MRTENNPLAKYVFRCRKQFGYGKGVMKGEASDLQAIVNGIYRNTASDYGLPDEIHIYTQAAYKEHETRLDRVCLLGIKRVIAEYEREHGSDGVSDGAKAEVKLLEDIFAERIRKVRKVCHATKGIACDYAVANGGYDLCTAEHDCPFRREEVR